MKRVLIIKLWALGDILMATPLLTALRQPDPNIHLTWIVDSSHAAILENHPLIDEVIPLDTRAWRLLLRRGNLLGWLGEGRALYRQMHERRFDAVINCHPEKWWTRWLCAAPVRIGLYPSAALPLSRLAYTEAIAKPCLPRHNTDHYLAAAEALGLPGLFDRRMVLPISDTDRQAVQAFLGAGVTNQPSKPLLVLHPGASRTTKCWPPASFAAVADRLQKEYNIILTGSAGELGLAQAVLMAMQYPGTTTVAAGHLTIGQTAALVSQAAAVVTGDTSVLHIASALQVPVVGLYGSTRPGDNAPLFGPHRLLFDDTVPCAPCIHTHCPLNAAEHLRCLRGITPEHVLSALRILLKETYEPSLTP